MLKINTFLKTEFQTLYILQKTVPNKLQII